MIRLTKETSRLRIYTIDDSRGWAIDATEEFVAVLASLLEEQARIGFYLSAITMYHGEHVIVFAPRPPVSRERGGLLQFLKGLWRRND